MRKAAGWKPVALIGVSALVGAGSYAVWTGPVSGGDPVSLPAPAQKAVVPKSPEKPSDTKWLDELKGEDWSRLSEPEKQRFVYTGIGGLERQGVFVTRPPRDYMEAIEKALQAEPTLKEEYLDNLFVFCVYDGEPQTREAIRRIRREAAATQGA